MHSFRDDQDGFGRRGHTHLNLLVERLAGGQLHLGFSRLEAYVGDGDGVGPYRNIYEREFSLFIRHGSHSQRQQLELRSFENRASVVYNRSGDGAFCHLARTDVGE